MARRTSIPPLAALLVALAACGEARQVAPGNGAPACTHCHGGGDNATGAPPYDRAGRSDPGLPSVGAHTAHVRAALACGECHPDPSLGSAVHMNGTVDLAFGDLATAGGTLSPRYDPVGGRCSGVYCHGAFRGGDAANAPVWTRVGQGQAACGTCHGLPPPATHPGVSADRKGCRDCHPGTVDANGDTIASGAGGKHLDGHADGRHDDSWMDPKSAFFHAYSANRGLSRCQGCHGQNLDGGLAGVGCSQCHGTSWKTTCTMCHGDAGSQNPAPPRATWGNEADPVRIGAHTAHVAGTAIAPPFDCDVCHGTKPTDALSPGHIGDPTATIAWGGRATTGGASPAWDRASATCASTYCHGNYSGTFSFLFFEDFKSVPYAGKNATPTWTGGAMTCTSCHGSPTPSEVHGGHGGGDNCDLCHPDANADGTAITNPALHVNGTIDVDPQWRTTCLHCH